MPDIQTLTHTIKFTVDSALLQELGERLVGKPYIAVAELVKNSYDADATEVLIRVEGDTLSVSDNGHGLTLTDFTDKWMRVGSTHKVEQQRSPKCSRPLTGSKGIGRLATQFLANQLLMTSVPEQDDPTELNVLVDWSEAITAGDLTEAEARYESTPPQTQFPGSSVHGTSVTVAGLHHEWDADAFEQLAREIWYLQPPFRVTQPEATGQCDFQVTLESANDELSEAFERQMSRILDIWTARLVGKLHRDNSKGGKSVIRLVAEIGNSEPIREEYPLRGTPMIDQLDFEIRIFDLNNRQPYGIPVRTAREYLNEHGGVHIYDAGFRTLQSGPSADWLRLEFDHAHRLSASKLLPTHLQVDRGLNNLPTNSRVWGVVNINTSHETRVSNENSEGPGTHLDIQVSRDRLVENEAFRQLRDAVRWALDYYAMQLTAIRIGETALATEVLPPAAAVQGVAAVLDRYREEIPEDARNELEREVDRTILAVRSQSEAVHAQVGLLSSLATAGINALAYDHQIIKQFHLLEALLNKLELISTGKQDPEAFEVAIIQIQEWLDLARETHGLFRHLVDENAREEDVRFQPSIFLRRLSSDMQGLLRGIEVDTAKIDTRIRLPLGTEAEWTSLFQNVILNASNAMIGSDVKKIRIRSRRLGQRHFILIEDTGVGVLLGSSAELFEPFVRKLDIAPERRNLGYGGTGLGLTIVRMLGTGLGCDVSFVTPPANFSTCFQIAWRE